MFYKNILVPVDESHFSDLAFQKALSISNKSTHLHIVHVINMDVFENLSTVDDEAVDKISNEIRLKLKKMVIKAKKKEIPVEYSIEYGEPKQLIAKDIPQSNNIDLIVMGAMENEKNEFEEILIGPVAEYVAQHAPCNVLIVRN